MLFQGVHVLWLSICGVAVLLSQSMALAAQWHFTLPAARVCSRVQA